MNVKSIERNGNEATIVVEIDKDLMESGVNKAYLKARKQIMIPGFRKGKAPRKSLIFRKVCRRLCHSFLELMEQALSGIIVSEVCMKRWAVRDSLLMW